MVILLGTLLLHSGPSIIQGPFSWVDALFTATSATCVTGLIVVDTGTFFTGFGQAVILCLIQLGGLGIMTVTGMIFYLWRRRVSLTDRLAVGHSLLHDPGFNLGRFLSQIIVWSLTIEIFGAVLISFQFPDSFPPLTALFHAISAFCNAGFSLYGTSLMAWQGQFWLNLTFIVLIIVGGIGFSVLVELRVWLTTRLSFQKEKRRRVRLSWYTMVILKNTAFLVVIGALAIYLAEIVVPGSNRTTGSAMLPALFQSVTCRTAGFNTLDIGRLTNVSLLIMIVLMFIGGAPGSCAGGIKVTTARTLVAFIWAQLRGSTEQAEVGRFAIDRPTINKALILVVFAGVIILTGVLLLNITESGGVPHPRARGLSLEILFEVVSAFATVGLSMGLTPHLSIAGKAVIIVLMFIGRLGPILFLSAIQSYQKENLYEKPEESLLIG
jgi:trk system potassium uptake protein TrkH